ncbi:MAG TPA: adenylosuccinate lyase [Candidatus Faecousia excrementigallinarum]|uniref:Adenylosuccinate lyase n=1 Tax=Candidatus Faecousia excrementigallinarum TaxID=2840806 RepID=A0A9D0Z2X4_9FIRM|nr:adenylosuccinate lyase [Candidatus Faecousia excrementigallinarum]
MFEKYESPLSSRYASRYMLELFSQKTRIVTWRKLWVALARAEMELGLPITPEQVAELQAHVEDIDFEMAAQREKEVRHDVMAHVYTYGKAAPSAAGIIHLGATSCYVTDNADVILYRDALAYVRKGLLGVMKNLADFARQYKSLPTLGYTHYQPAQLVTVGKRATLWLQDFQTDLEELDFVMGQIRFLGCRGTTGTEASFMELFEGDGSKIDRLNGKLCQAFGFDGCFSVCGQTYPRKLDSRILNCLSSIAQSAYRMAEDIRLLQHDRQLEEPFEKHQIGSSAMAYKRNPMRSERICSLSRYLMADAMNAAMTASTQWLERTLDDSANRRISLPEGFLCADAILRLCQNVTDGIHVNEKIVARTVEEYLPFIATENLLMEAVKQGGDRQELHEVIRTCSMEATARMKEGLNCDLLERLAKHPAFPLSQGDMTRLLQGELYIGRCPEQVENYLQTLEPILADAQQGKAEINV